MHGLLSSGYLLILLLPSFIMFNLLVYSLIFSIKYLLIMWVWRIWLSSWLFLLTLTHSVRIVSVYLPHTCLLFIGILCIEIVCSLVLSCVSLKINIFMVSLWYLKTKPIWITLFYFFNFVFIVKACGNMKWSFPYFN